MDGGAHNRYELLFMDDDGAGAPAPVKSVKPAEKKKQQSNDSIQAVKQKPTVKKTQVQNAEKENKANVLNKNNINVKKSFDATEQRGNNKDGNTESGAGRPKGRFDEQRRTGGAPGPAREQRFNRNSAREGGVGYANTGGMNSADGAGGDRPPRQYRDRDNRGPPRNRNGERFGKREFDRQSGSDKTGVKAVDKRDGAGAHNWGSVKQEIDEINKTNDEVEATLTDKEESANEQTVDPVLTAEEEEEAKQMTLDEWKALREQRATKPSYNIRKAGEGEDTSQWKKMIVLNKKKSSGSDDEYEFDPSLYPQRVGRLQRITDIQFNFNDGRRGGFGRGGRGGFGRGGGAGGERGGRFEGRPQNYKPRGGFGGRQQGGAGGHNALKVDDERQFPTLS